MAKKTSIFELKLQVQLFGFFEPGPAFQQCPCLITSILVCQHCIYCSEQGSTQHRVIAKNKQLRDGITPVVKTCCLLRNGHKSP